ncbi:MAG: sulfatase-like hydrolase/transferase [Salinigranum sp.]
MTRPNVLLVVLDAVRARNTTLHGHDNDTTPFLATLADEATVYEQARAPGTESISSHTSLFTGLHVREHRITNRRHRLEPGHTVWERLASNRGYDTGVFSNNPFLTELPVGLSDAFETIYGRSEELPYPDGVNPKDFVIERDDGPRKYLDFLRAAAASDRPLGSLVNGLSFKLPDRYERRLPAAFRAEPSAERYADFFLEWHAERDGPWAACLNFMDAHFPYAPGEYDQWGGPELARLQDDLDDQVWEFVGGERPWWQRRALEALYDGAVRRMDAQVGRLVETLARRDDLENTLLVVTADHGEGFGERSLVRPDERLVGHGNGGVDEELLHVPLVVRPPGGDGEGGRVVDEPASLTRFPAVVEAYVEGESETFVPEGPVVASTDGIDPDTQERASRHRSVLEPLTRPADAVYEAGDGGVRKFVRWGDRELAVAIRGATAAWVTDEGVDRVGDVVDGMDDASVGASAESVDADVKQRLEDLGYA